MPDEHEIVDRLTRVFSDQDCFGPVTEELVVDAERELGVYFPRSYRFFLRNFGASLFVAPYEIAGLPNTRSTDSDPPYWSNVIDDTVMLRRASAGHIPDSLVSISSDGGDYKFYLDTSISNSEGESPVVALGPGVDDDPMATSFLQFVEKVKAGVEFPTTA